MYPQYHVKLRPGDVAPYVLLPGDRLGYTYHVGTTRSADTFYACHPRPGSSFNNFWQSNWREHFEDLKRLNVVGAEMEASIIFVLAGKPGPLFYLIATGGTEEVLLKLHAERSTTAPDEPAYPPIPARDGG